MASADANTQSTLPAHVDETVRLIARLHAEHHHSATRSQRAVERMTRLISRPRSIGLLLVVVFGWVGVNLLGPTLGYQPIDPPPFALLEAVTSMISLGVVLMILATQRREDELAAHRERLTLELAILSEQKTAKIIQLLEESRKDNPLIHDRVDHEADAMARSADPQSVIDAIKETHANLASEAGDWGPGL